MTTPGVDSLVETALQRHRDLASTIAALSAELPKSRRGPWLEMASILASGEVARATRAVRLFPSIWLPLLTNDDSEACLDRLFAAATAPLGASRQRWGGYCYALAVTAALLIVLNLFARSVIPIFRELLASFGMELPFVTQLILGLGGILSDWRILCLLLVTATLVTTAWFVLRPGKLRRRQAFADTLSRLLSTGTPRDNAVALAAGLTGLPTPQASPSGAFTVPANSPAIAAAYALEPSAAPVLLAAIAANYGDRSRKRRQAFEWLLGPVAVVLMGLAVGFTTMVLFMPLIKLVGALS